MGVASRATAGGLLWLLVLAAGVTSTPDSSPAPQTMSSNEQQPAAAEQLSASEQLSQLLDAAVQRVLERRAAAVDCSQLEQLQHRLDLLELRAAAGQCQAPWKPVRSQLVGGVREEKSETQHDLKTVQEADPEPTEQPEPEPEPEPGPEPESPPECDQSPSPLPAYQAPHQRPEKLACARSCLQLRDQGGAPQDGVYWFTGMPVPVLCDFSHDGGGWTLLLTAKSRDGWNLLSVRGRRERSPSLDDNYSILRHADTIRDLGNGTRFAYRIETQAETGRQRWGGVWVAPRRYSFMAEHPDQTEVICVRKFDKWVYKNDGIHKRMPWLHMRDSDVGNSPIVLTTSNLNNGWGSLLYDEGTTRYHHSPWSNKDATNSGKVLYWMREEFL